MNKLEKISKVVSIDFETANPSRDSACALGLCVFDFPSGNLLEKLLFYINPNVPFAYFNSIVNGITPSTVKNAPPFSAVLPELERRLDNETIVVAHNASFDTSVLVCTSKLHDLHPPRFDYFCTYILARALLPGMASYSLPSVAQKCGVPAFRHHRADDDAEACGRVFVHFLRVANTDSVAEFVKSSGVKFGKVYPSGFSTNCRSMGEASVEIDVEEYDGVPLEPVADGSPDESSPFFGKTVVFTGALSGMPRSEAERLISAIGGRIGSGVTSKTNFIVCGYQDPTVLKGKAKSSKLIKAEKLAAEGQDIQILAEEDFFRMI